ncbi:hypothetical protein JHL17_34095 [Azospirillum sp. YIM B02556]|uniref:Uncharacterized protein n=1 Tax=Azospirillum endophyticum TaxID=2800326 RepID=A0ABS1FG76_9PROT|nr:hypothetical protein [Azospirillum endophyticum]MBK1842439.1 hypothetical protein [Azospirillum endophyticum]
MFGKKKNPYALSPEVRAAITAGAAALQDRKAADAALLKRMTELRAAEEVEAAAVREMEQADAALALAIDPEQAAGLEKAVTAASRKRDTAAQNAERTRRMVNALHAHAQQADERVNAARQQLAAAFATFQAEIVAAYDADVRAAAAALVAALKRGWAIRTALRGKLNQPLFLDEINVPSVIWRQPAIVHGPRANLGGETIALDAEWSDEPTAADAAGEMQALSEMQSQLERHRPFDPANPFPTPSNREAFEAELARAIAEYSAPPEPPKPSRGLFQSWTLGGRWAHQDSHGNELNITTAIASDETAYEHYQPAQR